MTALVTKRASTLLAIILSNLSPHILPRTSKSHLPDIDTPARDDCRNNNGYSNKGSL